VDQQDLIDELDPTKTRCKRCKLFKSIKHEFYVYDRHTCVVCKDDQKAKMRLDMSYRGGDG